MSVFQKHTLTLRMRDRDQVPHTDLATTLKALESTEANLQKAERLWGEISGLIPNGLVFGDSPEFDELRRRFAEVVSSMPKIDGWQLDPETPSLNQIARWRFDAKEIDDIDTAITIEEWIARPGDELAEYRFRFDRKRRALFRGAVANLSAAVDQILGEVKVENYQNDNNTIRQGPIPDELLSNLRSLVGQIGTLLGSSVKKPARWTDLQRHLYFGQIGDLVDIVALDWPVVKPALQAALYGTDDPLPVSVADLGELVVPRATERIPTRLAWERVTADEFERLIYLLLSNTGGYENAELLTATRAPDRGRDVSAWRVQTDPLSGTLRERVIVQCKHWLTTSISISDVATIREQMRLWEPPRVDILIIATSGHFSADTVRWIENHNTSDAALRIEMWPQSRLDRLLAERPALIAEFHLR